MKTSTRIALRKNSIFSILVWTVLGLTVTILYHYIQSGLGWTPRELARIDTGYSIISILVIVIISVHIVGLIFREIEQAYILENIAMKRFFPLINVLVTALIWIVGVFYVLDSLGVNMSSILTGAGISGVFLAIASRDIITNLFGSLSILLSRTFEIGEIIRLRIKPGTIYEGIVEEITLNYTKITNLTGEVVFIPNRTIYIETVENISHRRFYDYTYRIPFRKDTAVTDIRMRMRLIEDHIAGYDPIEVLYETEIPNAADLVYKITIMLPEANETFDDEMRHFLMGYIFVDPSPAIHNT